MVSFREDVKSDIRKEILKAFETYGDKIPDGYVKDCPACAELINEIVEITMRYAGFYEPKE